MNKELIKEIIKERNPKALFLEKEFDEAIVGTGLPCGGKHVAVYDSNKCIKILMKKLKTEELEAFEQFQITSEFSSYSENKPIFLSDFRKIKLPPDFKKEDRDKTINDII